MELKIEKNTLVDALTKNVRNVSGKKDNPILEGIFMKVEKNGIQFIRSNGDESVIINLPTDDKIEIIKEGTVVIHRSLTDIAKKLKDTITLKESKSTLLIQSEGAKFEIPLYDSSQYPKIDTGEQGEKFLSLPFDEFKDIVEKTAYCHATSESRPILRAISFKKEDDKIQFASTNSHILVRKVIEYKPVDGGIDPGSIELNPPAPSLIQSLRMFNKEDKIDLYAESNHLIVTSPQITFRIRLLDGNYPDIGRLINTDFQSLAKINRKEMIDAVEQLRLLITTDKSILTMSIKDTEMSLKTSTTLGKCDIPLTIKEMAGENEVDIAVNVDYLLNHLRSMDGEIIQLGFLGHQRPIGMLNEEKDGEYRLVLPIRTT